MVLAYRNAKLNVSVCANDALNLLALTLCRLCCAVNCVKLAKLVQALQLRAVLAVHVILGKCTVFAVDDDWPGPSRKPDGNSFSLVATVQPVLSVCWRGNLHFLAD